MKLRLDALAAAALAGGATLIRLPLLSVRDYDPDELQHLHSAYSIAKGLLPYRDYFEHHTPLLHFLVAPFLGLFDVETSALRAFAFLSFARGLMWLAAGAILALTFCLARDLRGGRCASYAAAFLGTCWLFFDKTLEVRPDVPACALLVAALRLAARGVDERVGMAFVQSGLLCGLGLLFTQKLSFALLGLLLGLAAAGQPLLALLAWGFGLCVPILLTLAYFLAHGALSAFLEGSVFVNLHWRTRFPPGAILREELLSPNAALCAFALVGLFVVLPQLLDPQRPRRGETVVTLAGLFAFAGLWIVPVPWQQYYLTFLPVMAVLAGLGLQRASESLAARLRRSWSPLAAELAAAFLLLLGAAAPLSLFRDQFGRSNADKLASLRFVIENTAPSEAVLDGYTGIGVFRPHAWRYFFLHAELRQMLGDDERRELLSGLRSGELAPRLISYDGHSSRVSPEVTAFFLEHYEAVGQGPIWARVFPPGASAWDDAAPRPVRRPDAPSTGPYALVGQGWSETEQEAGVRFRRSRGRLSLLLLPVREPRAGRLVLRARAGSRVAGLAFEVVLNKAGLGSATPRTAWSEHVFEVPEGALRHGLNRLVLRYPRRPNQADPGHGGPNATIALESVRIEPRAR